MDFKKLVLKDYNQLIDQNQMTFDETFAQKMIADF
jgi:hypothetical protein